jgi:CRP-like cAMP-binding protein
MPTQLSVSTSFDPSVHRLAIALDDDRIRNELLLALPGAVLARLRPHLKPVWVAPREVLFDADAHAGHVYFPESAVISLSLVLHDGGDVETGTVGREGMAGLSAALGIQTSPATASTQIAGTVRRMRVQHLTRVLDREPHFRRLIFAYADTYLSLTAQTAACNRAHLVEQRCARWLLATRDRVDMDTFPLAAQRLADTLGVRRTGVMAAMRGLEHTGLIHCERDEIAIRDRPGLERVTCECYQSVRMRFERFLASHA